jgi:hypothetical protein
MSPCRASIPPASTPWAGCSSIGPGPDAACSSAVISSTRWRNSARRSPSSITGVWSSSGTVDELATSGDRRLVVRIEGDRTAGWARNLPGVTVSEEVGGAVRMVLAPSVDSDDVLKAAMQAGRVTQFSFERRRLSEVFRESLA